MSKLTLSREIVICPTCEGEGGKKTILTPEEYGDDPSQPFSSYSKCTHCLGSGRLVAETTAVAFVPRTEERT